MSVNLAKFKHYLDEKDYEAMRKELRTLPKRPGQMATWAIRTDHADDIYFKLYYTPLLKKTPTQAIAQQLIESNLFNEIHYQRGVKTSHLLGILNQYRNSDGQLNSCAATGNSPN